MTNQASAHLRGRRKSLLIANTMIVTSMRKVCAKIVTTSRAAPSLPLAAQTRKCTLKNYAKTVTWSTTERKRGKIIGTPRLLRGKWSSHSPPIHPKPLQRNLQRNVRKLYRTFPCDRTAAVCSVNQLHRQLRWNTTLASLQRRWCLPWVSNIILTKIRGHQTVAQRSPSIKLAKYQLSRHLALNLATVPKMAYLELPIESVSLIVDWLGIACSLRSANRASNIQLMPILS